MCSHTHWATYREVTCCEKRVMHVSVCKLQTTVVFVAVLFAYTVSATAPTKPHILLVLVDDWGWANVGYHRNPPTPEVVTPNFDRLCKEGVELDQHYVHAMCSPSRSSLLSGRLPSNVNLDNGIATLHNAKDPVSGYAGIPLNMTVIAAKLKQAGYATHHVGKWDAGFATTVHTPLGRGFDTTLGYFHHQNDYYTENTGDCIGHGNVTDLWMNTGPAVHLKGTDYEENLFKEQVLKILEEHDASKPLFLYYGPHIAHEPLQVPDVYLQMFHFIDDETRRRYHAMVTYLDDVVGNVTAAMEAKGMWNNTLMVVSTDNGGPTYPGGGGNNYPLRGGKLSNWQGGVRGNAFISGGFVPAKVRGTKNEGYIHLCDWYTTFCALAGVEATDEQAAAVGLPPVDGVNVWPLVSGQNATSPRTDIFLGPMVLDMIKASGYGLIKGDYKILVGAHFFSDWTGPQYPNMTSPTGLKNATAVDCGLKGCLYNIKKDPEEYHDLANDPSMKTILTEMRETASTYYKGMFQPNRGYFGDPKSCRVAFEKYNGFWGPWVDL
eukprot:m.308219 g.308219  ORF g.308219 m.308219 type:complete len:548 (+) comp43581_c0_seq1:478-2121(+)